jgi:RecA-family ATPase
MQTLATCITAGLPVLGRTVIRSPVAYYSCEDDDDVLHHRQARINDLLGLSGTPEGLFIKSYLGHDLTMFNGKVWTGVFDWLFDDLAKIKRLGVAILDPASEFYIGEFADPVSVKGFCRRLDAQCYTRDITLFLLMHTPKGDAKTPFGSVQWLNAARTTLMLDPATDEDGTPDRHKAILRVAKGNYIRSDEIPLIWTEDGLLVQADEPDAYEKLGRVKDLEELVLRLIQEAYDSTVPLSDSRNQGDRYLPAKAVQASKGKFTRKEAQNCLTDLLKLKKVEITRHGTTRRVGLKVV